MLEKKQDINERLEKGAERLAALEVTDRYARKDIESLHTQIEEQEKTLNELLAWKRDCDNTNKVLVRVAMCVSAIATSIGVWMENIKGYIRAVIAWAA